MVGSEEAGVDIVDDRFHEACGVAGVLAPAEDAATLLYFALYALQHRGQEAAGICSRDDGGTLHRHRGAGLVAQVFTDEDIARLPGAAGIGHTRYSTAGGQREENAQPLLVMHPTLGEIAYCHNGNLTNAEQLREALLRDGERFEGNSDTELIGALLRRAVAPSLAEALSEVLPQLEGAFSLLFLSSDELVAVRDPWGIRPLVLGRLGESGGFIAASESCALDTIGAELLREVEPGEMVVLRPGSLRSLRWAPKRAEATCVFEFIYFSRPDSVVDGRPLYEMRRQMGRILAAEAPVDADIVVPMPDSGTPAAVGFAEALGLPFVEGMIKSRYITRTFIQPTQRLRELGVRLKFNPMPYVVDGKKIVLVDDSIVRGTTSSRLVAELRRAGAAEVHLRVASPPVRWPCFLGIDLATRDELIAAQHDLDELTELLGADSLAYLSLDGLRQAIGRPDGGGVCFACFTGRYPVNVHGVLGKRVDERVTSAL